MTESRGAAGCARAAVLLQHRPGAFTFAMAHEPRGTRRRVAVVFCHALAEEKLWSHRVYVNFAREAAALASSCCVLTSRGEGESDRDFENTNVATRVEDVGRCVEEARSRASTLESIVLVGHRFRASIAAAAAQGGVPVAWPRRLGSAAGRPRILHADVALQSHYPDRHAGQGHPHPRPSRRHHGVLSRRRRRVSDHQRAVRAGRRARLARQLASAATRRAVRRAEQGGATEASVP